ncbi:hypothetical protein EIN_197800 [Entamoeba invadens IP1]|uniref:Nucleoplasmin-like domain-containing protein n=1 Tax=Entamoeba invadens IP1 TaxID=370355 RepID=A0A0A1TUQ1_ENTIV|nr:hypothetical protein EIN_197800 [Entamoeba invadens IP1]ELP83837.1 hypothetical protein EIN_197800 [Entamoeba invadens IP1]|eukprot:XP_004183183.1 hypothetical protein EIN_197800 [Entamoeba invadens IP1]
MENYFVNVKANKNCQIEIKDDVDLILKLFSLTKSKEGTNELKITFETTSGKSGFIGFLDEKSGSYQIVTNLRFTGGDTVTFMVVGSGELYISGCLLNCNELANN